MHRSRRTARSVHRVASRERADPTRPILADRFEGKPLGRLNDLVVDRKGTSTSPSAARTTLAQMAP